MTMDHDLWKEGYYDKIGPYKDERDEWEIELEQEELEMARLDVWLESKGGL